MTVITNQFRPQKEARALVNESSFGNQSTLPLPKLPDFTLPRSKASAIAKFMQTEQQFTMLLKVPTVGGDYAAARLNRLLTGQMIWYLQRVKTNSTKFKVGAWMKVNTVP